ncbi:MAG TPA: FliH/SctL family protein [Terriglobales bacterium]|jgi:type III secretion protein L|nr:FliH/SctL family protein [Terriglobales bacterium]
MSEKILKADGLPERMAFSSPKILKREAYEATQDAKDVVTQAQEKAKDLLESAERQRDAILETSRQEGRAQGLAEWNNILAQAARRSEELTKNWEETMLQLSVRVAEKIIGEQLKLHPDTIVAIVREALTTTRAGRRLVIQVNDREADIVRSQVDRLKGALGPSSEIEVVSSTTVPTGGCVIESELGIIDARLETQLKCLEDVLLRRTSSN